jgi:hypothetical protein
MAMRRGAVRASRRDKKEASVDIALEVDRAVHQLLGRASGPMHLRLLLQPLMATIIAVRAGLRDARAGSTPFLARLAFSHGERHDVVRSAWADIGKVFLIALVLDSAYQIFVLHAMHPLQTLIVAVVLAFVPYLLVRGLVTRMKRRLTPRQAPMGEGSAPL